MEILEGKTTIRRAAERYGIPETEIRRWRQQFLHGGERALRSGRQATRAGAGSAARLQAIIDNTTAVIYVKDTEGRYEIINRQFERIFHVTRSALQGRTDYDLFPATTADAFRENDRRVLEAGAAIEFEELVPHDDGPHSYISIKFPLFDSRGKPDAVCGISTDITERKRANERLQKLAAELDAFYQAQPDLCFQLALDGTILEYKAGQDAELYLPPRRFLGQRLHDVLPADVGARFAEAVSRAGEPATQVVTIEYALPMPDGQRHYYEARLTPLGNRERILALIRDTTIRKQAEEKLELLSRRMVTIREEEQQRMGLDLHDGVCQELVGIGIMLAAAHASLGTAMPETAAKLTRAGECLGEVVDHLRMMARELRPMFLHDLGLEQSLRTLALGLSAPKRRVVVDFPERMPSMEEATEIGVYRIAQEALTNAARHARARLTTLTVATDRHRLQLTVRDNGRGFDLHAGRPQALGIVGMEQRATTLGGRLTVDSAPGRGTTVAFECPLRINEHRRETALRGRATERRVRPR